MILRTIAIFGLIVVILSSASIGQIHIHTEIEEAEDEEVKLDGSIIAEISDDYQGAVFPSINLSDSYTLRYNVTQIDTDTYQLDDSLKIDVAVINNATKTYTLGRHLTCFIIFKRETTEGRFFDRIQWSFKRFNVFSYEEKYIEIPLNYKVNALSENATLYIFTLGTLTGVFNPDKRIVANKRIDIDFLFSATDLIDTIPPVTICILEGNLRT